MIRAVPAFRAAMLIAVLVVSSCSDLQGGNVGSLAEISPVPLVRFPAGVAGVFQMEATEAVLAGETEEQAMWLVEERDQVCGIIATRTIPYSQDSRSFADLSVDSLSVTKSCGPISDLRDQGLWLVDNGARTVGLWIVPPTSYWDDDWQFVAGGGFDRRLEEVSRTKLAIAFQASIGDFDQEERIFSDFRIVGGGEGGAEWGDSVPIWVEG